MTADVLVLVDRSGSIAARADRINTATFVRELSAGIAADVRVLAESLPEWEEGSTEIYDCRWDLLEELVKTEGPVVVVSDFVQSAMSDLQSFLSIRQMKRHRRSPIHTVLVNAAMSDTMSAALLQHPARPPWLVNDAGGLVEALRADSG